MNSMVLMVEMMVALALRESEQKLVSAAKLEKKVRELMDPSRERGEREGFNHHRWSCAAIKEGGSSHVGLAKLAQLWKQNWHEFT